MFQNLPPVKERVAKGISLLDKTTPGWRDKVDWSSLRMASATHCVLGQIFLHFDMGVNALFGQWSMAQAEQHGFYTDDFFGSTYGELKAEWLAQGPLTHEDKT